MGKMGIPRLWSRGIEPPGMAQDMGAQYWHKIRSIRPLNLIAYWPLWETTGVNVDDYTTHDCFGVSVDLGARAAGSDGVHQAALFDGVKSYVNVWSLGLKLRFNGAEGTYINWAMVHDVGVWTDGLDRYISRFRADANNALWIQKTLANLLYFNYKAGGVSSSVNLAVTPTAFMCLGLTWSKAADRVRAFYNGPQTGVDQNGLGVWAGALDATKTVIGAATTTPTSPWYGWIDHCALWNVELSPSEMLQAAEV